MAVVFLLGPVIPAALPATTPGWSPKVLAHPGPAKYSYLFFLMTPEYLPAPGELFGMQRQAR